MEGFGGIGAKSQPTRALELGSRCRRQAETGVREVKKKMS